MSGSTSLSLISELRGVLGCALVEGSTGMVIEHKGSLLEMEYLGEMAVEFWRVHGRLPKSFNTTFGIFGSQLCIFEECVIALIPAPFNETSIFICIGRKGQVDWPKLGQIIRTV